MLVGLLGPHPRRSANCPENLPIALLRVSLTPGPRRKAALTGRQLLAPNGDCPSGRTTRCFRSNPEPGGNEHPKQNSSTRSACALCASQEDWRRPRRVSRAPQSLISARKLSELLVLVRMQARELGKAPKVSSHKASCRPDGCIRTVSDLTMSSLRVDRMVRFWTLSVHRVFLPARAASLRLSSNGVTVKAR